jgi:hypothetical protein
MHSARDAGILYPSHHKEPIMKTRIGIVLLLALGLLTSSAQAGDAVLGAIIGGGLGAVVGKQTGGHNGAIIGGAVGAATGVIVASHNDHRRHHRSRYYAPPPVRVYAPAPVYYVPAPVYYRAPQPVVYVPAPPPRNHWRNSPRHNGRRY